MSFDAYFDPSPIRIADSRSLRTSVTGCRFGLSPSTDAFGCEGTGGAGGGPSGVGAKTDPGGGTGRRGYSADEAIGPGGRGAGPAGGGDGMMGPTEGDSGPELA